MLWKTLFVSSIFVLWCFVCQQWYVCGIKQNCKEVTETKYQTPTATRNKKVAKSFPILFQGLNEPAVISEDFPMFRDSILKELRTQKKLKIIGFYFENEGENVGLKRAQEISALFLDSIAADRIMIESKMLKEIGEETDSLFEGVIFQVLELEKESQMTKNQEVVVEIENGALIYFPFNSTKKEVDSRVNKYLQQLTMRLQNSNEKIRITGHTDNVGDAKANYDIGLQRAKAIRKILIEQGLSRRQITVFSKGETEPLASNETEASRQKNRRTAIKIFK